MSARWPLLVLFAALGAGPADSVLERLGALADEAIVFRVWLDWERLGP